MIIDTRTGKILVTKEQLIKDIKEYFGSLTKKELLKKIKGIKNKLKQRNER